MSEQNLHKPDEDAISLGEPEPLTLEEDTPAMKPSALRAFGQKITHGDKKVQFKRTPAVSGQGAVRCRVFHSKIAVSSMDYMQNQINEWLDNDNIEVKHVGHVIGTLEGKTPEPNVIVMVWY